MAEKLKRLFIPNMANDFQPFLLRGKGFRNAVFFVIFLEIVFLAQIYLVIPNSLKFLALVLPDVIISETNENRQAENLSTLTANPLLQRAAQEKADDMAKNGYFSHNAPDGTTPWYWFEKFGYSFVYAGENLALNFTDSKDVVDAWMNSSGHRANILNKYFSEIGVGVAQGTYEGSDAIFVVQFFGRQAPKVVSKIVSNPVTTPKATAIASPIVSVTPISISQADNFVAVKSSSGESGDLISLDINLENVSENVSKSLVLEKFFVNPKMTMLYIYVLLGFLVLIVILLSILIKIETQYPKLILNGILILLLIGGLIIVNQFLISNPVKIV